MSCIIEVRHEGPRWGMLLCGSRQFCLGYLHAILNRAPRLEHRLLNAKGKVIAQVAANPNIHIGQVAGWPTAEQYEAAAERALAMAAHIRAEAQRVETQRVKRRVK